MNFTRKLKFIAMIVSTMLLEFSFSTCAVGPFKTVCFGNRIPQYPQPNPIMPRVGKYNYKNINYSYRDVNYEVEEVYIDANRRDEDFLKNFLKNLYDDKE